MTNSLITKHTLPDGSYYVGCPCMVLEEEDWNEWWQKDEECFEFKGHKVVSISTGGDGYFPLYDLNEEGTAVDQDDNPIEGPVLDNYMPTDVATLAIIPYELIKELGSTEEAEEYGCFFDVMSLSEDPADDVFDVEIHHYMLGEYRNVDHVKFLWFEIPIKDTDKYEKEG